jgi:hypothetical protein
MNTIPLRELGPANFPPADLERILTSLTFRSK